MWNIPLFKPDLAEEELQAVQQPLRDGWLTMGPATEQLEARFGDLTGAARALAVTNCTAALHLAMVAAGVGPGHEVIVPSLTFVASANAARYCGARVVFADIVGDDDLNVDPEDVRRKITSRTRAIVVVHYAGFPVDMDAIGAIARERGLVVVEDCAHALITRLRGRSLGTLGAFGCFSFFPNKNMTSGEGGMLITDDVLAAERIKLLRSHGMTTLSLDRHAGRAWSYDCVEVGWNYRIDDIRASLAVTQLKRLPALLQKRALVRQWYREDLAEAPVKIPFTSWDRSLPKDTEIAYHIMPVLLPRKVDREQVMRRLKGEGIQSSIHYPAAHLFSFARREDHAPLPVTEDVARRELTLPFYPSMSRDEVRSVCRVLAEATTAR